MQQPPISPDGNYWWNGVQWVPRVMPPPGYGYPDQVAIAAASANAASGRWSRGWRITKLSWAVLSSDKQLLLLPIFSLLSFVVMLIVFAVPALGLRVWEPQNRVAGYVLGFAVYFVSSFITYFFGAAMIAAATMRLRGMPATAAEGLAIAWSKVGKIAMWSLVSATVGVIIRQVEQRLGILGAIVGLLAGLAWAVATAFMVPVLVFEDLNTWDSIKRSGAIIKQRWGEGIAAGGSAGLIVMLGVFVGLAAGAVLFVASPLLAVAVWALTIVAAMVIGSALSAVYRAAIYQYAVSGSVSGGFSSDDLAAAFRPRRRRR